MIVTEIATATATARAENEIANPSGADTNNQRGDMRTRIYTACLTHLEVPCLDMLAYEEAIDPNVDALLFACYEETLVPQFCALCPKGAMNDYSGPFQDRRAHSTTLATIGTDGSIAIEEL